ncbi:hypothetical protein R3P38DRAFT_2796732 [Favolaschia claudopus]|uniref:Uncharacterized protein n=1 Tax=Favolaschia claudopus TaxID=2862362 RepID=A0AAW0A446_9AGAR
MSPQTVPQAPPPAPSQTYQRSSPNAALPSASFASKPLAPLRTLFKLNDFVARCHRDKCSRRLWFVIKSLLQLLRKSSSTPQCDVNVQVLRSPSSLKSWNGYCARSSLQYHEYSLELGGCGRMLFLNNCAAKIVWEGKLGAGGIEGSRDRAARDRLQRFTKEWTPSEYSAGGQLESGSTMGPLAIKPGYHLFTSWPPSS